MMNIKNAVRQMRTARRLGKISLDTQDRVLRRLGAGANDESHWHAMMGLRAQIEKAIRPALEAKREAELAAFDVEYSVPASKPKKAVRSYVTAEDLPSDPEATPAWWNAAMLRERELRKLGVLVD